MHPLDVPQGRELIAPGLVETLLTFGLLAACLVGLVVYLVWKLPRGTDGPGGD